MKTKLNHFSNFWVAKVDTLLYIESGYISVIFNNRRHDLYEGSSLFIPQFYRIYIECKECILHQIGLFDEQEEIKKSIEHAFLIED